MSEIEEIKERLEKYKVIARVKIAMGGDPPEFIQDIEDLLSSLESKDKEIKELRKKMPYSPGAILT